MAVHYTRSTNFKMYGAATTIAELDGLGVEIPVDVRAAQSNLQQLEQRLKDMTAANAHRKSAVAVLLESPDIETRPLALAELAADVERNMFVQAIDASRANLARAVSGHSDALTTGIETKVFTPAVAQLTTAAATPTHASVTELTRAGKTKEARALADAPAAVETIRAAHRLRSQLYRGSDINTMSCARWRNPETLDLRGHEDLDYWLTGIRQGGELWLGTYNDVDAASRAHDAARAAEQKAAVSQYVGRRRRSEPDAAA